MSMLNFNLRGISPEIMALLKSKAKEENLSVNALLLQLIKCGIGYNPKRKKKLYHDLDHLAGTWTQEELEVFQENTALFENIDKELW